MKTEIFRDVTLCRQSSAFRNTIIPSLQFQSVRIHTLIYRTDPEDGGIMILRNVGDYLPVNTA